MLVALMAVSPWMITTHKNCGKPISSNVVEGVNFYSGPNPKANETWVLALMVHARWFHGLLCGLDPSYVLCPRYRLIVEPIFIMLAAAALAKPMEQAARYLRLLKV